MPPKDVQSLPFLTRDMLAFQHAQTFQLQIDVQASTTGTIFIRGATREGTFSFSVPTVSSGALQTLTFNIPDIPILLSVKESGSAFAQGACYCTITLLTNGDPLYELCSGYIYEYKGISYPQTSFENRRDMGGRLRSLASANPGAGAQISLSVATNFTDKVLWGRVTLVTDATVANRRLHVIFTQQSGGIIDCIALADQAASLTRNYSFAPYGANGASSDDNDILIPIPPEVILTQGSTITTTISNGVAGDDLGAMTVYVQEFFQQ